MASYVSDLRLQNATRWLSSVFCHWQNIAGDHLATCSRKGGRQHKFPACLSMQLVQADFDRSLAISISIIDFLILQNSIQYKLYGID